jgi:membrane protein
MFELINSYLERLLWNPRHSEGSDPRQRITRGLRYPYALLRDALEGQLTLRAMSLVYTTLLSIVPLIALSFSVLKGFGVHQSIEPLLQNFLMPLGDKGIEVTARIVEFVDRVRGDLLGILGLVFLIITVVSLIQKVEEACNYVWQVERPRTLARRMTEYLSILLVGPVLMVAAIAMIASIASSALVSRISSIEPFGTTLLLIGRMGPFFLVIFTFTFLYGFVPNTRVQLSSAIVGGVTAGLLWTLTGKLFASFVATSTQYSAIYSGFAIGIVALIWVYLSWLILLLGADVAFYHQNPLALRGGRSTPDPGGAARERLALGIMYLVGTDYVQGRPGWTAATLSARFATPSRVLGSVQRALRRNGLLLETDDGRLVPARDLSRISLADVITAARHAHGLQETRQTGVPHVDAAIDSIEHAIGAALEGRTLRDLVAGEPPGVGEGSEKGQRRV